MGKSNNSGLPPTLPNESLAPKNAATEAANLLNSLCEAQWGLTKKQRQQLLMAQMDRATDPEIDPRTGNDAFRSILESQRLDLDIQKAILDRLLLAGGINVLASNTGANRKKADVLAGNVNPIHQVLGIISPEEEKPGLVSDTELAEGLEQFIKHNKGLKVVKDEAAG